MSPLYTVFRFSAGNLTFLEYFFDSTFWHDYMRSIANFGARHDRMNITSENFFALPILFPSSIEQEKIADFFTSIDEKINSIQSSAEVVKQLKLDLFLKVT